MLVIWQKISVTTEIILKIFSLIESYAMLNLIFDKMAILDLVIKITWLSKRT